MSASRAKIVAAVLLAASLALPQSSCAGYLGADGTFVYEIPRDADRATYRPAVEHHYALDDVALGKPDTWLPFVTFLWPLMLLPVGARLRPGRFQVALWLAESLLVLGSGWVIWFSASFWATPAVGAYVALGALGLYFGAWLFEAWSKLKERRLRLAGA